MNARQVTKTIIKILVNSGTSAATANLVANNRSHSDTEVVDMYYKTSAYVGGAAAGWMVGDYVSGFAVQKVDELFDTFEAKAQSN